MKHCSTSRVALAVLLLALTQVPPGVAGQPLPGEQDPKPAEPPLLTRDMWTNSGLRSPGATISTYFWSMREGDLTKMGECMSPAAALGFHELLRNGSEERMTQDLKAGIKSVVGYRLLSMKVISTEQVLVEIETQDTAPHPGAFNLRKYGPEWKLAGLQEDAATIVIKAIIRQFWVGGYQYIP